ncbi:BMP family ABC transporter substrate-binding protein [Chenggangzhangella methanolivorans]|uniref:BMP family ABC transporter substrate-binding protein n=1 Tax=Chenggangzhangella methanolivorans TaxID=1437009 RepID=A0A9E6UL96_9HYPH|nr:BMP family ABC transporter substrate-binding protein [Chenggangzhangella methanolivorans]QZO00287.1 BMP family ABC transporter substrate-binding protein [Chenggangzhangella methanolivorans]
MTDAHEPRLTSRGLDRRSLLIASGGATLAAAAGLRPAPVRAAENLVVGVVYVGPRDDFGWNQSHASAIAALKATPGVKVLEEERVPESIDVVKTMESMIELDGAKLIFGTSFGYFNPFMIELAKKYPDVQFRHPTTLWSADKHPKNLGGYFASLDQAHYASGVAAGLSSKSGKLGFIAAKPISIVLRSVNQFTLGARKANSNATVRLAVTGEWSLPVREAEMANSLIDQGCDLIACHVDSPKIIVQTAEARGVKSCGHNASQASLAPKGFVTGAELKYETIYKGFAELLASGKPLPNVAVGGFDKDMVRLTPYGAGATEEARKAAEAAIAELAAGKPIYVGPIKDNKGATIVAAGQTLGNYAPELDATAFLVEGVQGSLA